MDWWAAVDGYCERLGPGLWAEPLNLVSNLAFLLAAAWVWPLTRGHALARGLAVILALIGLGSALFHSFANRLSGLADVLPILVFVLLYIFAASRNLLGLKPWAAALTVLAFFPFAALTLPLFQRAMPWLGSSTGYAPIPLLMLIYAALLGRSSPSAARRMAVGAALLILSLTLRSLDLPACQSLPYGTHFLWHLLNAVLLVWMIETLLRHPVSPSGRRAP
jgi:hypothetical protein